MTRVHWPLVASYWRFQREEKVGQTVNPYGCDSRVWKPGGAAGGLRGGTWNNISESQQIRAGKIIGESWESGVQPSKFTVEERENGELSDLMQIPQFFGNIMASSTFIHFFFQLEIISALCQEWNNWNCKNWIVRKLSGLKNTPLHKYNQVAMQDVLSPRREARSKKLPSFPKMWSVGLWVHGIAMVWYGKTRIAHRFETYWVNQCFKWFEC